MKQWTKAVFVLAILGVCSAAAVAKEEPDSWWNVGLSYVMPETEEDFVNDGVEFFVSYNKKHDVDIVWRIGGSFAALSSDIYTYVDPDDQSTEQIQVDFNLMTFSFSWLRYEFKAKGEEKGVYYGGMIGYVEADPSIKATIGGISATLELSNSTGVMLAPVIGYSFGDKFSIEASYHYYFDLKLFRQLDPEASWDHSIHIMGLYNL